MQFSKVVSNAIKRIAEDPESRGRGFAGLIMRKAKTGPAMNWRTDKHGPNMTVDDSSTTGSLLRRDPGGGNVDVDENGQVTGEWGV